MEERQLLSKNAPSASGMKTTNRLFLLTLIQNVRLLKYADEQEGQIVRKEIADLKLALDLMA